MSEKSTILKNSSVLALISLLSKGLGYVRDALFAWFFGASAVTDSYYSALRVVTFFRKTASEGNINAALSFALSREKTGQDGLKAQYASSAAAIGLFFSFLTAVLAYPLSGIIFPGRAETASLYALIMILMSPQIFFIALFSIWQGILNSKGSFAAPALIQLIFSVFVSFSAFILREYSPRSACLWAAAAGTFSCVIQFYLFKSALKKEKEISGVFSAFTEEKLKETAKVFFSAIPSGYDYFIFTVNMFFSSFFQTGALTAVYNAARLAQFPLSLASSPAAAAAASKMADYSAKGLIKERNKTLAEALKISFFWTIPAAAGLFVLANPVSAFLFKRGAYGERELSLTVSCLKIFSLSIPFISAAKILISFFYACGRNAASFIFLIISMLSIILLSLFYRENSEACAYSSMAVSAAGFLFVFLDRQKPLASEASNLLRFLLKAAFFSAVCAFFANFLIKAGLNILLSITISALLYYFISRPFLEFSNER